jgi:signal transduction histidine kinase
VIVLALAVYGLVRPIEQQLGAIRRAAERFGNGELGARADIKRADAIGMLGNTFNNMAGRIEATVSEQQELLRAVSHELRTPLVSIIGFAEFLRQQTVGSLNAKQARYIGHIHQSGKHLLQFINDILDLSKVEAGKFILEPEPLDLAATLEDILVIARGLAHQKAQTIETEIAPDLPPLRADPVRFKQICFNLLSNAIKFTPAQGQITLAARQAPGAGDWLELRVTDTGVP